MRVPGAISRNRVRGWFCLSIAALLLEFSSGVTAGGGQTASSAELTTREAQPTFKMQVKRNLVLVRVVVRDAKGHAVGDLRKQDFRLFDDRKPQTITQFAVERISAKQQTESPPAQQELNAEALPETAIVPSAAQRYLALYFDDVHATFEDLARTRDAADRYLNTALQPGDRAGIFTSSGQTVLDFTDDRAKLRDALFKLLPRPVVPMPENVCPEIFDWQAYMIVDRRDPFAIEVATEEGYHCRYENSNVSVQEGKSRAQAEAESEAMRVLNLYQTESEFALRGLEQLVRRISLVPGRRSIVLVSPGFLTVTQEHRVDEIVERALRANVVINTFDAMGLFAFIPLGDASKRPIVVPRRADVTGKKSQLQIERMQRAADVLRNLASDTGGECFQNNNDFDEGFRRTGALPEVSYVLAFSPQNLKFDGRFHSLKVSLASAGHMSVQARRGYYAPRKPVNASGQAKEEIEQAVFSQDELNELPVEVHTQFFKLNGNDARLSILTQIDLHFVRFRKEGDRNLNNLKVVTALFDRDGNYVTSNEKMLEFRLRDGSLAKLLQSGINMKTSFDVKPGTYLVRQVVRDSEEGQMSGLNRTVEIPF